MLAVKDNVRTKLDETMRGRSFAKIRTKVLEEHRSLLAAVENGKVKLVSALLREHLEYYGT
jgi:DNA-binding GntR family transcriptional regulator